MPKIVQHPEILVQARRGGTVESLHRACAALAGPDGEIVERWGDPGMVTYWRSSAKPLQAQAWLADGTVDALRLGRRGARHHERLARGPGLPGGPRAAHARRPRPHRAGPALRRHAQGAAQLLRQPHRLPRRLRAPRLGRRRRTSSPTTPRSRRRSRRSPRSPGSTAAGIATGVDGCGIVCYATPVTVAAATYALLPELLPEISAAMRAHPELVEGSGLDRHRGDARAPRRHQQVRRRGPQLLLAARRARPRRQGRRRRRPRPRAGRPRRARGGRRRRTP